jgi:hypothetical protein
MREAHTMMTTRVSKKDDFKQNLRQLKNVVDPGYLVESLGFNVDRETGREIRAECIIHGGDNKTAFRFNKETKTWVCFTRRCHEIHGYDIIGLIQATLGYDFMSAVNYLRELVGDVDNLSFKSLQYELKKEKEEFIRRTRKFEPGDSIVTEESLRQFKAFRSNHFLECGFSRETLDYFEVAGGYTDKDNIIRDIIPIRNAGGELAGYSLRDIRHNADYDRKYIHTYGFDKDHVLYNLHNAKEYGESVPLVVVEGQKSVWKMREYGIHNVVACMGSKLTPGQCNLLCSYAIKGVITMFDNDVAGVRGTFSAHNDLYKRMSIIPIFITETDEDGNGLDPSELSKEIILEYLEMGE